MSQERTPARRSTESVARQEEKAWVAFYAQVRSDVDLAAEILAELDCDDVMRRRHRGLYLCCQRCIRLHENREARNRRIGQFVRGLFRAVFIAFPKSLTEGLRRTGSLGLECLPETSDEPAERQVRRLLENEAYAQADRAFRARARKAANRSVVSAPTNEIMGDAPAQPKSATG